MAIYCTIIAYSHINSVLYFQYISKGNNIRKLRHNSHRASHHTQCGVCDFTCQLLLIKQPKNPLNEEFIQITMEVAYIVQ